MMVRKATITLGDEVGFVVGEVSVAVFLVGEIGDRRSEVGGWCRRRYRQERDGDVFQFDAR